MTNERLTELRALAEAATPGPWSNGPVHISVEGPLLTKDQFVEWMSDNAKSGVDGPFWSVAQPVTGLHTAIVGNGPTSEKNAALIAASRTAIPELLDTIDRVRNLAIKALRNGTAPSEGSWCSAVSAAELLAVLENRPEREEDDELDALDALDGILDDR